VLFLTLGDADFLADSLLHGLRAVLGAFVVDYPRQDILYEDTDPSTLRHVHGRGFTLYGQLEEIEVDRVAPLQRIGSGEFDLVVFADIWQQYGLFLQLLPQLNSVDVAVLDGQDLSSLYPYAPGFWRRPRLWALPRAHTRVPYFKRELTETTLRIPVGPLSLPARGRFVRPLAFSIPEQWLVESVPEKTKLFPRHIVDPELARRLPNATLDYAFDEEDAYFDDLRLAGFGITTKRTGWDCMRHYELAASGCVLCFRALNEKPLLCAPHGLDNRNCLVYRDADDLEAKIAALDDRAVQRLQEAAMQWAAEHTTRRRAEAFLADLGYADAVAGLGMEVAGDPRYGATRLHSSSTGKSVFDWTTEK
jgi:hypothetical protein